MREYRYRVDGEGRVFHDGSEVLDPPTLRFFLRAMTRTPDGRWLVVCQGERNWFEPESTPFVVQRVRPVRREGTLDSLDLVMAASTWSRSTRTRSKASAAGSTAESGTERSPRGSVVWLSSSSARTSETTTDGPSSSSAADAHPIPERERIPELT